MNQGETFDFAFDIDMAGPSYGANGTFAPGVMIDIRVPQY